MPLLYAHAMVLARCSCSACRSKWPRRSARPQGTRCARSHVVVQLWVFEACMKFSAHSSLLLHPILVKYLPPLHIRLCPCRSRRCRAPYTSASALAPPRVPCNIWNAYTVFAVCSQEDEQDASDLCMGPCLLARCSRSSIPFLDFTAFNFARCLLCDQAFQKTPRLNTLVCWLCSRDLCLHMEVDVCQPRHAASTKTRLLFACYHLRMLLSHHLWS